MSVPLSTPHSPPSSLETSRQLLSSTWLVRASPAWAPLYPTPIPCLSPYPPPIFVSYHHHHHHISPTKGIKQSICEEALLSLSRSFQEQG